MGWQTLKTHICGRIGSHLHGLKLEKKKTRDPSWTGYCVRPQRCRRVSGLIVLERSRAAGVGSLACHRALATRSAGNVQSENRPPPSFLLDTGAALCDWAKIGNVKLSQLLGLAGLDCGYVAESGPTRGPPNPRDPGRIWTAEALVHFSANNARIENVKTSFSLGRKIILPFGHSGGLKRGNESIRCGVVRLWRCRPVCSTCGAAILTLFLRCAKHLLLCSRFCFCFRCRWWFFFFFFHEVIECHQKVSLET